MMKGLFPLSQKYRERRGEKYRERKERGEERKKAKEIRLQMDFYTYFCLFSFIFLIFSLSVQSERVEEKYFYHSLVHFHCEQQLRHEGKFFRRIVNEKMHSTRIVITFFLSLSFVPVLS